MSCYDSQGNELPMLEAERRKDDWLDSPEYWINEFQLITESIEDKWIPVLRGDIYDKHCNLCNNHLICDECCIVRLSKGVYECLGTPYLNVAYDDKLSIKNEIRFLLEIRRKIIGWIPIERRNAMMEKVLKEKVEETLECNECYETWNALGTWVKTEFILTDEDDEVCPHCGDEFYSVLHVKK